MYVRPVPSTGKIRYCKTYIDKLTGRPREISTCFDKDTARNRKEAEKILNKRIEEKQGHVDEEYTLRQLIDEYISDQKRDGLKESTFGRNERILNSVAKIIGENVYIERMTARQIRNAFLDSGKSGTTLDEYLTRFRAMMRWAYKNDLAQDIKAIEKLERFQREESPEDDISALFLESDELRTLLAGMKVPVWSCLTEFIALTGMRIGEIIALEKSDIDMTAKVIRIRKTYDINHKVVTTAKTVNSMADVYIQPQLEPVIRRMNVLMNEQKLQSNYRTKLWICNKHGDHMNYETYNKYLKENTAAILGKQITPHGLRHTHASLLFEQGMSYDEVARRLRHGDSAITKRIYVHITEKLKQKDREKLSAMNLF